MHSMPVQTPNSGLGEENLPCPSPKQQPQERLLVPARRLDYRLALWTLPSRSHWHLPPAAASPAAKSERFFQNLWNCLQALSQSLSMLKCSLISKDNNQSCLIYVHSHMSSLITL